MRSSPRGELSEERLVRSRARDPQLDIRVDVLHCADEQVDALGWVEPAHSEQIAATARFAHRSDDGGWATGTDSGLRTVAGGSTACMLASQGGAECAWMSGVRSTHEP